MKASLQTRFSPLTPVYDTDAPATAKPKSIAGKIIMGIVKPYVRVDEGSVKLFEYNQTYRDESIKWNMLLGAMGLLVIAGGASVFFKLGRMTK